MSRMPTIDRVLVFRWLYDDMLAAMNSAEHVKDVVDRYSGKNPLTMREYLLPYADQEEAGLEEYPFPITDYLLKYSVSLELEFNAAREEAFSCFMRSLKKYY